MSLCDTFFFYDIYIFITNNLKLLFVGLLKLKPKCVYNVYVRLIRFTWWWLVNSSVIKFNLNNCQPQRSIFLHLIVQCAKSLHFNYTKNSRVSLISFETFITCSMQFAHFPIRRWKILFSRGNYENYYIFFSFRLSILCNINLVMMMNAHKTTTMVEEWKLIEIWKVQNALNEIVWATQHKQ